MVKIKGQCHFHLTLNSLLTHLVTPYYSLAFMVYMSRMSKKRFRARCPASQSLRQVRLFCFVHFNLFIRVRTTVYARRLRDSVNKEMLSNMVNLCAIFYRVHADNSHFNCDTLCIRGHANKK